MNSSVLSPELQLVLDRAALAMARGEENNSVTAGLGKDAVLGLAAEIRRSERFARQRLARLVRRYTNGRQMILEADRRLQRPILDSGIALMCLVVCPARNDRRLGNVVVLRLRNGDTPYRLMLFDEWNVGLSVVRGG